MGKGAYLVRFHLVGDWGFGQAGRSTIEICFLPISLRQIIKGQGTGMPGSSIIQFTEMNRAEKLLLYM
jgi:hypothetical protein